MKKLISLLCFIETHPKKEGELENTHGDGNCGSFFSNSFDAHKQEVWLCCIMDGMTCRREEETGSRRVDLYPVRGNKSKGAKKKERIKAVTDGCFFLLCVTGGSFHLTDLKKKRKIAQKQKATTTNYPFSCCRSLAGLFSSQSEPK